MAPDEPKVKSLSEILEEGYNWHKGLSTIIVDMCTRVSKLEEAKNK